MEVLENCQPGFVYAQGDRRDSLYNYTSYFSARCINIPKSIPCLNADLRCDSREKANYPAADHSERYIFPSTHMTTNRTYKPDARTATSRHMQPI